MSKERNEMGPEGQKFLEGLGYEMEAQEIIDKFNRDRLGRPVDIYKGRSSDGEIGSYAGVVLPINKDNTSHFWLFNTGDMLVTVPDSNEENSVELYKSYYAPKAEPHRVPMDSVHEIIDALHKFPRLNHLKIILDNSSTDSLEKIYDCQDQAIEVATQAKVERETAKRQSTMRLKQRLEETIFKPDSQRDPDEPPQFPPQEEK